MRAHFDSSLLLNGLVLITGGHDGTTVINTSLIFNPTNNSYSSTGNLIKERAYRTLTTLTNGKVLAIGGIDSNGVVLNSIEIFDPNSNTFSVFGSLLETRVRHTSTLLSSGRVLVVGGNFNIGGGSTRDSVEIIDPVSLKVERNGVINTGRAIHTSTTLQDKRILIIGGENSTNQAVGSIEVFVQ